MPIPIDLTGKRFGKLLVIREAEKICYAKTTVRRWVCLCDCGNTTVVRAGELRSGDTTSCGCHKKNHLVTHGLTRRSNKMPRLYRIWEDMKSRCTNKNLKCYHRYGGRGIEVCDEWKASYKVFEDWALRNGYSPDLTIDRIDNDGNYEPSNCRWATAKEQANNRSTNRKVMV